MAETRVKVGIIGLGHNGRQHAVAHAASPKSELIALCDRDEHKLRWIKGGNPSTVFAYSNHFAFPELPRDDCMVSLFKFQDGAVAKVAALWAPVCPQPVFYNLRVYGTKGTIVGDQLCTGQDMPGQELRSEPIAAPRIAGHPYDPEIDDWLSAIIEDGEVRTSLIDGANSTMAALRAARAAREARETKIPLFA